MEVKLNISRFMILIFMFSTGVSMELNSEHGDIDAVDENIVKDLAIKDRKLVELIKEKEANLVKRLEAKEAILLKRLEEREAASIKRLEEKEAAILTHLNDKEDIIEKLETQIVELQVTVRDQRVTIEDQQQHIITLEDVVNELKKMDNGQEQLERVDDANIVTGRIHTRKTASRNHIRQVENEISVAFLASLTNHTFHLGAGQHIEFDNVITNIGSAYHPNVGAFIAPVSGVYVFSTTLMRYDNTETRFQIRHNGERVVALLHQDGGARYDTTSATVAIQLKQGDDVAIVNLQSDEAVNGYHYCSFTGFLLNQIYDDTSIVG